MYVTAPCNQDNCVAVTAMTHKSSDTVSDVRVKVLFSRAAKQLAQFPVRFSEFVVHLFVAQKSSLILKLRLHWHRFFVYYLAYKRLRATTSLE